MDMRGTIWVTAHHLEEIGGRSRSIDGVLCRLEAVEPELAVLVCAELASQVVARLVLRVEDVVFAVGAGLPHVEDGVGDALVCLCVFDYAVKECEFAVRGHVLDDAGAEIAEGDQKGPRMAEEVGTMPCSVTILWLISSTRLENEKSAFVDIQIASLSRIAPVYFELCRLGLQLLQSPS